MCGGALLLLASLSASAQGSIIGVTVAPAQAAIGQEVVVAIGSTDNTVCAELQIGFGDGTGTVLHNHALIPGFQLKHQYRKAGTFTVLVRAINDCSGFEKGGCAGQGVFCLHTGRARQVKGWQAAIESG